MPIKWAQPFHEKENQKTMSSPEFLDDYHTYCSCYEIPRNYIFWSAITLLGACIHKRAAFNVGDIAIHGNLYTMLVGPQGNGKTTSCDFAKKFFIEAYPDLPIGAYTQSAEDIVKIMASDDFPRTFTKPDGSVFQIAPYAFFMNEFKNFVAYSPSRMLAFLTDIYDRDKFDSSTIKRSSEVIINPCLTILACENPDWLIRNLRADVVSGGFSRRVIYVYEIDRAEPKPIISITPEAELAKQRVLQRLRDIKTQIAQFQWTESGKKFFIPWYVNKQKSIPDNLLMGGYVGTKHIQLFKVAMLLDFVSNKPMHTFTDELLMRGLVYLDAIEENMPKLSLSAGRNELAISQQKILEKMKDNHGVLSEKEVKKLIETDLTWQETAGVIRHLEETEQIVRREMKGGDGVNRQYLFTAEEFQRRVANGIIKIKP